MLPPLKIARASCCFLWFMGPGFGGSPLWARETSHLDGPLPAEGVGGWGVYYSLLPDVGAFLARFGGPLLFCSGDRIVVVHRLVGPRVCSAQQGSLDVLSFCAACGPLPCLAW